MANLVLDIGNVLVHFKPENFFQKLQKILSVEKYQLFSALFAEHLQTQHEIGLVSFRNFLPHFEPTLTKEQLEEILDEWNKTIVPENEIIEYILNLIEDTKNYYSSDKTPIALLSNIGSEHVANLKKICPELISKTTNHFSCEVGARKPSKIFFQSFIWQYPEFNTSLYLDDRIENLNSAKSIFKWWKPIHFCLDKFITYDTSKKRLFFDALKLITTSGWTTKETSYILREFGDMKV